MPSDVSLSVLGDQDAPVTYTVPGAQEIVVKTCQATYDGTAAGGPFLPIVQFVSPAGRVIATAQGPSVAAGSIADVSFFPHVAAAAAAAGATGTYCEFTTPAAVLASGAIVTLDLTTATLITNDRTGSEEILNPIPVFSGQNFAVNPGVQPNKVTCKSRGFYWVGVQLDAQNDYPGAPASWPVELLAAGPWGSHTVTETGVSAFPAVGEGRSSYGEVGYQDAVATQSVNPASGAQFSGVDYPRAILAVEMIYLGELT